MNGFIDYLNSTNNVGGDSTGSLAETQVKSEYYDYVKIDRAVGSYIYDSILSSEHKAFILTGHAGDGKTSILVQVLKNLGYLGQGEGLDIQHEYENFYYVKDMSEIAVNDQVNVFAKVINSPKNEKTSLMISNTGPLLNTAIAYVKEQYESNGKVFDDAAKIELQSLILNQLDKNEDKEILLEGKPVVLVNIARIDNVQFACKILERIVQDELWVPCSECSVAEYCPIRKNRDLVNTHFVRVSAFIENFYRYLYENDRRMTIRQMVGQIGYALTGNLTCERVRRKSFKFPEFNYNFANLFFGYHGVNFEKNSLQIAGIKEAREFDLDGKALNSDYRLFVNRDYSDLPHDVREILNEMDKKYRLYYQNSDDSEDSALIDSKRRRAVRRFYLVYGEQSENANIVELFDQVYGDKYSSYIRMISGIQPRAFIRKIENIVFNALYMKNTGILPISSVTKLPLTLRRDENVFQNVMLILGFVEKGDIRIKQAQIMSRLEDQENRNELFLEVHQERFRINYPMFNYFSELISGAITSNSNPALTHGIAALDAMLLKEYSFSEVQDDESCEVNALICTSNGPKIVKFEIDDKVMNLIK